MQFPRWQLLLGRPAPGTCPRSGEPFSHRAQVTCKTGDGESPHACRAGNRAESGRKQACCLRSSSNELTWAKKGFPQLFPKVQETSPSASCLAGGLETTALTARARSFPPSAAWVASLAEARYRAGTYPVASLTTRRRGTRQQLQGH